MDVDGYIERFRHGKDGPELEAVIVGSICKVIVYKCADQAELHYCSLEFCCGGHWIGHWKSCEAFEALRIFRDCGGQLVVRLCYEVGVLHTWRAGDVADDLSANAILSHVLQPKAGDIADLRT